ncbi:MAG: family 16 glycosylhydrolase [Acidimicrobiales bacterium]
MPARPRRRAIVAIAAALCSVTLVAPAATATSSPLAFPVGTPNSAEPSGLGPPGPNELPGYYQSSVTSFTSGALPAGWEAFIGKPGSDPGAQWAATHVRVGDGLLTLSAFPDPAFGNAWVTGGLCQCGVAHTYGAYFVRSRLTGPGPTQVELLWPTAGSGWPPEIDFSETYGLTNYSMATAHFTSANKEIHDWVYLDVTQWHTWGVVWSATSITYTVDGRVWGSITRAEAIPQQPMTLDIQQQTWCQLGWACPTSPQELQVNWVAEYQRSAQSTFVLSPFAARSSTLTPGLETRIAQLVTAIRSGGERRVLLVGYGDQASPTSSAAWSVASRRAEAVKEYLSTVLATQGVRGISITPVNNGNAVAALLTPASTGGPRRVVALLSR